MSSNLFAESLQIMTRAFNDVNQSSLVKKKLREGKLIFFFLVFLANKEICLLWKNVAHVTDKDFDIYETWQRDSFLCYLELQLKLSPSCALLICFDQGSLDKKVLDFVKAV